MLVFEKKTIGLAFATATLGMASPATAASLIINGDFEASSSPTATPTGWTNIGHTDGVIAYSAFGTPAYNGNFYYDIGGFGSPTPAPGDGITQTVGTNIGSNYILTFGYSGENTNGVTSVLDVLIGSVLTSFTIISDASGLFKKPFTTASIAYTATSNLTQISFVQSSSTRIGFNDALVDGVDFSLGGGNGSAVPEPGIWAMMIVGFGLVGGAMRRRKVPTKLSYT